MRGPLPSSWVDPLLWDSVPLPRCLGLDLRLPREFAAHLPSLLSLLVMLHLVMSLSVRVLLEGLVHLLL